VEEKLKKYFVVLIIPFFAFVLSGCGRSRAECLESATALYQQELNYQKSLYAPKDLTPEQVGTINQHYNDYRSACTK